MRNQAASLLRAVCLIGVLSVLSTAGNGQAEGANFCQGCRSVVSFLETFNSTRLRDEYKTLLTDFCQLYYPPSTDFQNGPCPAMIKLFYDGLDHIDTVNHCDSIGACQPDAVNTSDLQRAGDEKVVKEGGLFCDACEQLIKRVQKQAADPRFVDEIHRKVNLLCDYLKVVDQDKQCRSMLLANINQALEFIRALNPLDYCQSIQLCSRGQVSSKKLATAALLPTLADFNNFGIETNVEIGHKLIKSFTQKIGKSEKPPAGPNCAFCKEMVKEIFKFVRDNRTEESIRNSLDKVCQLFFHDTQKFNNCKEMVDNYSQEIIDMLTQETDPDLICTLLEQCSFSKLFPSSTAKPVTIADELPKAESQLDFGTFITSLDQTIPQQSMRVCLECKMFIKYLRKVLSDPKSVSQVNQWLKENLCKKLDDAQLQESCTELVDKYGVTFFKALINELDSENACVEMGACTNPRSKYLTIDQAEPMIKRKIDRQKSPLANSFCLECSEIITRVDEFYSINSLHSDIDTVTKAVCKGYPDIKYKDQKDRTPTWDQCATMILASEKLANGSPLPYSIATMESPKEFCRSINFC